MRSLIKQQLLGWECTEYIDSNASVTFLCLRYRTICKTFPKIYVNFGNHLFFSALNVDVEAIRNAFCVILLLFWLTCDTMHFFILYLGSFSLKSALSTSKRVSEYWLMCIPKCEHRNLYSRPLFYHQSQSSRFQTATVKPFPLLEQYSDDISKKKKKHAKNVRLRFFLCRFHFVQFIKVEPFHRQSILYDSNTVKKLNSILRRIVFI